ncbi:MAG: glycosyltransferase [Flavobacteriaceae bacterium]|nr:glycosyltransferase [Flavobacteriaceae bacterium]
MKKSLHIVSFDVPYPPNYGGVIDVFYKLKALAELGVEIYLHCYSFGREESEVLLSYCKKVYYYKRRPFLNSLLSTKPFRVKSRANPLLLENLKSNDYPILFEGLHSTHPLLKESFNKRTILIRAHNIEHNYYRGLAKSERSIAKKLFYQIEGRKFYNYQKTLLKANHILTIAPFEQDYFSKEFGEKAVYIPVFHQAKNVKELSERGKFALFHGDLRVPDNVKAVVYLISIFRKIDYPLVVASSFSNNSVSKEIEKHETIEFREISTKEKITKLLEDAHINVLPTFQKTGIKLKLINALFNGRHVLVTKEMAESTGLESLCLIANDKDEFKQKVLDLINKDYTREMIKKRREKLKSFNVTESAKKILELLY